MTAAQHDRGSVARGGGLRRGWEWGQWVRGGRVWRWVAGAGLPAAEEAERERGGRCRLDLFAISEKFRGPTIKQK